MKILYNSYPFKFKPKKKKKNIAFTACSWGKWFVESIRVY